MARGGHAIKMKIARHPFCVTEASKYAASLQTRVPASVALLAGSAKRKRATVTLTVNVRDHLYVVLITAVL